MRYLLMVYLFEEGALEDLLTALTSLGIENAVVLDGQRMNRLLAFEVPIFAGFREDLAGGSTYCRVLSVVIDDPVEADELLRVLKEAEIDFSKEGIGAMMVLPLERWIGWEPARS